VQRGGLELTEKGSVNIDSIFDLLDAEVQVKVNGRDTTLKSPWSSSADQLSGYLPALLDKLTTSGNATIPGRVNVNHAPFAVLAGLPGMTDELADRIAKSQLNGNTTIGTTSDLGPRATIAWLLTEGLTDVATMRKLDAYITARGDVYRAQSVGYFDEGGPAVRLEAVIDASAQPPLVRMVRDLSEFGRGYTRDQLGVAAELPP
jgi:hypothetical protein